MNRNEYLDSLRKGLSSLSKEEQDAAMSYYEEFFSDAGEDNEQAVIASLGSPEQLASSILNGEGSESGSSFINNNTGAGNKPPEMPNSTDGEIGASTTGFENNTGYSGASTTGFENNTGYVGTSSSGFENNTGYAAPSGGFGQNQGYNQGAASVTFVPPPTGAQTAKKWTGGQIALVVILLILSFPIWIGIVFGIGGTLIGLIAGFGGAMIGVAAGAIGCLICGIALMFSSPLHGLLYLGFGLVLAGLVPLVFYPLCKLAVKLFEVCIKGIQSLIRKISGKEGA